MYTRLHTAEICLFFKQTNKDAIQSGQQDKGLNTVMCTGPGHVGAPTWLLER